MYLIDKARALMLILILALTNSLLFIGFNEIFLARLVSSVMMNISGFLLLIFAFKTFSIVGGVDSSRYFKILLSMLLLWGGVVFFRGGSLTINSNISLFGHYLMGWAWLTPLAFVFGLRASYWYFVVKAINKALMVGCFLTVFVIFNQVKAIAILEILILFPIYLIACIYSKNKESLLFILSSISFLLLTYYASQRVNVLFFALIFTFIIIEYFRASRIDYKSKVYLVISLVFSFGILLMVFDEIVDEFLQVENLMVDTRSFLFEEIFDDMLFWEQVIGRGALGTYFSPYFSGLYYSGIDGGDWMYRQVNEVGYLQMLLKGGWVMVVLNLLILVPAAFLGVLKSHNYLSKICGYYILTYLIIWGVSYYPVFSAEYILLWMATGTVISNNIRQLSDREVSNELC